MASVIGTFVPTYQGLRRRTWYAPTASDGAISIQCPHRISYYRARNAIYHLFRALLETKPSLTVSRPTITAATKSWRCRRRASKIHYCPVAHDMRWDPTEVERLCRAHSPDLLYVIHYAGWPQPIAQLAELCRRREMLLVEDCALSLLSESEDGPLGSLGQLVGVLPLQDAAIAKRRPARAKRLAA